ncbi:hypothetical protein B0H67DRAFT_488037 [Lasiosphaeris hirsuta]|uniref:Uncharacterized protein n=1 Tax=Lasiosphaeris hirsuta TaxID=260670 RepID=A0AA40AFA5_9PEZI|nr:hypothetical protein B0H67DRAFT_488037 [Lasiosphaeris hirsuta]
MATESLRGRSDEATVTSEPAIKIDTDSHNVDSDQLNVNGDAPSSAATDEVENKHISDVVDDLVNSTEVSISGGSDNEASKGDASKHNDGEKGHGRTSSSVKKPASFKSINVNKTFLTTKGAAPSAPVKASDKVAPAAASAQTGTLTPRPRLIVKSGSGSVAKSSAGANGGKPATGAAAVWNKNQPVPAPEPKKYTDEELKKYGIHMTDRLHPDDTKGQANWADIDDDDEDWAPETITWKDGTQIAIPHTEEHTPAPAPAPEPVHVPAPAPAPAPVYVPRPVAKENGVTEKAKSPAPIASPVIKPGVLASGKGLILKGAVERPTLVAKPPAPPTPVKSPWAPIPKVDKVSPVVAEATPHQSGARFAPKDAHVPIPKTNTPPPPKEIAADDFSRAAWRDGSSGTGRELFNSQSGRYEPVPDRRGSLRPETQHGRQPALLQRSSHHDQQGPLDPTEQAGPYGRRRGSSNVSGGSGSYMHRSLPPPELIARRESMTGRSDSPASPRNFSPSGLHGGPRHGQAWPPRASPSTAHATPYQQNAQPAEGRAIPPPVVQPSMVPLVAEEEFELQKRLMRERRELAMKRRLEEEAREEAAKQERIRLKLEALGPAPESKSSKKAAVKDEVVTPTHIKPRETPPAQGAANGPKAPEQSAPPSVTAESTANSESLPNGTDQSPPPREPVEARNQPQGSTHAHPWPNSAKQPERYPPATWGAQTAVVSAKNVWGAPNNNRSLGNGTFNADLGAAQLAQLAGKTGPGPIAPPASARTSQTPTAPTTGARQPPIAPPKQTARNEQASVAELGGHDKASKQSAWVSAVRQNEDAFRRMLDAEMDERDRKLQSQGRTLTDLQPVIKDTWRQTKIDNSGTRDESASKQTTLLGADSSWVNPSDAKPINSQQAPSVGSTATSEYSQRTQSAAPARDAGSASILTANNAAPQSRGSRFFPAHRERHEASSESARPKSPSPPPPDMAGHPAFDGDVAHPHVSLPRPQPVVRLPPSASTETRATVLETVIIPTGPASKTQGPTFAWASQAAYKEDGSPTTPSSAHNAQKSGSDWQAKFDSLLGGRKTHTAPRSPVADAVSHSNDRFGHAYAPPPRPAVTLPPSKDGSITTKVRDEECFEEQEMGSLPPVRLPNQVPDMAWQPSPTPKPLPKKLYATVSSADSITFPPDMSGGGNVWRVSFPGFTKDIVVPFGRARSNPRRGGPQRGGRHPPATPHTRPKGREGSSSYPNDQGSSASGSNPPPNRNSRGGFRGGRSEGWSRNVPAPIQT